MIYNRIELDNDYVRAKVLEFISEDAPNGDLTADPILDGKEIKSKALMIAEQEMVYAGEKILFALFESNQIKLNYKDGAKLKKGDVIAEIVANSQEVLLKERVLLNLTQRLSGIATMASIYAKVAEPYNVKILDTRKTTPGLRLFEKYAVGVGGAYNHRLNLSTGILIKDNHLKVVGSITEAISIYKNKYQNMLIELEVDTLEQLEEGLEAGANGFLLDNMSPETCRKAIKIIEDFGERNEIFVEASGGITLDSLEEYCRTGVDAISVGALTHSVKAASIHLEFEYL